MAERDKYAVRVGQRDTSLAPAKLLLTGFSLVTDREVTKKEDRLLVPLEDLSENVASLQLRARSF